MYDILARIILTDYYGLISNRETSDNPCARLSLVFIRSFAHST